MTTEEILALPPSGRIKFALDALKEMESADGWEVDMYSFHNFDETTCFACLGGAAAIKAWGGGFGERLFLETVGDADRLFGDGSYNIPSFERSLDSARVGLVGNMFFYMGLNNDDEGRRLSRDIADYHLDRDGFFKDMEKLAKDLEDAGY